MKKKFFISLFYFFCVFNIIALNGKITYLKGSVYINYAPADLDQKVEEKDLITTHEGRVELTLSDGNIIRIGENSRVHIDNLKKKKNKDKKISVKVFLGKIWTKVKNIVKEKDEFSIKFRMGTAGVRGTVYRLNQYEDDSAEIYVYEGKVEVSGIKKETIKKDTKKNEGKRHEIEGPEEIEGPKEVTLREWVKIVEKMNKIYITSKGEPEDPKEFKMKKEKNKEWVKWNLKRDKK
jgi:ferric-dicitrate binding protein FerR (iron transport regulator)